MERDEDEVDAAELRIDEKPKLLSILRSKEEEEEDLGVVGDTDKVILGLAASEDFSFCKPVMPISQNRRLSLRASGAFNTMTTLSFQKPKDRK